MPESSRWSKMTPEQRAASSRASQNWVERNRERVKESNRRRYHKNKSIVSNRVKRHREKNKNNPHSWCNRVLAVIRLRCKKKNIPYSICADDVRAVFPDDSKCPVLGIPFVFGTYNQSSPTIDRLIPSLGYIKGNISVISRRANTMKSDCTSPDELRAIADWMESQIARSAA